MEIIQNAVRIHDKVYRSTHVHDYVQFEDELGQIGHIDGGHEYIKKGGAWILDPIKHGVIDMSLQADSPTSDILNKLTWGTYGVTGTQGLVWRPIRDLDLPHLEAILRTQTKMHPLTIEVIQYWINHYKDMGNPVLSSLKDMLLVGR